MALRDQPSLDLVYCLKLVRSYADR